MFQNVRVVSASGSETRDSSSTPASAVIYDAYNSNDIVSKNVRGLLQQVLCCANFHLTLKNSQQRTKKNALKLKRNSSKINDYA